MVKISERHHIDTYKSGFAFSTKQKQTITKGEYIDMCIELEAKLNALHNTTTIRVLPEPISEGGFVIEDSRWQPRPGRTSAPFKTLRHHFGSHWQWIPGNVMEEWRGSQEQIVLTHPSATGAAKFRASTFCKAFDGATAWTKAELTVFSDVFQNHGFLTRAIPKFFK